MEKLSVGDRVYHLRKGDRFATRGYGRVLQIEGSSAIVRWEHNGQHGGVEVRDLLTEIDAAIEGL